MPSVLRSLTQPLLKTFHADGRVEAPKVKGFSCYQRPVETFFDLRDLVQEVNANSHLALSLSIPRDGDFASLARNAQTMAVEAMSNVVWVDLDTEVPDYVKPGPAALAEWAKSLVYPQWGICGLVIAHSQSSEMLGRGRRVHIGAVTSKPVVLEVRQALSLAVGGDPAIYSVAQMVFIGSPRTVGFAQERNRFRITVVPPTFNENSPKRDCDYDFLDVTTAPCLTTIQHQVARTRDQDLADEASRVRHWINPLITEGLTLQGDEHARTSELNAMAVKEAVAHFLEVAQAPLPTVVREYEQYIRDGYKCGYVKITSVGGRKRRPTAEGVAAGEWDGVFTFGPELEAKLDEDLRLSATIRPVRQLSYSTRKLSNYLLRMREEGSHVGRRFTIIRKLAYTLGRGYALPTNDKNSFTNYKRPLLEGVVDLLNNLILILTAEEEYLPVVRMALVESGVGGWEGAKEVLRCSCSELGLAEAAEFQAMALDTFFAGLAVGVAQAVYRRGLPGGTGTGKNKKAVEANAMERMEAIMVARPGERQKVAYRQLRWADRHVRAGMLPKETMDVMLDVIRLKFEDDPDAKYVLEDFERRFRPREGLFKKVKRVGKLFASYLVRTLAGCYARLVQEYERGFPSARPLLA